MQRRIELDGCLNFRDLGGYPTRNGGRVRWRRLFRSDALHHLTPAGVAVLRGQLGVGCVVDLRSSGELEADGRGLLASEELRFHHLPLFDDAIPDRARQAPPGGLGDRYFLLAEFAGGAIAKVLTVLARSEEPAVYHCAAGKDRTGVLSAILLGLLDVPDEIVVADYAATQDNLDAIVERLLATEGYQAMLAALPPDTLHAEPETMIRLIERVRERYGGMREYARAAGVLDADVDRLRERCMET